MPRIARRGGLPDIAVFTGSGLGDCILAFPALRALAETHNVYVASRVDESLRNVLLLCPYVLGVRDCGREADINPYVCAEEIERIRREPRQANIARRLSVAVDDWAPLMTLPGAVYDRWAGEIDTRRNRSGRPVVAVALSAGARRRTMPEEHQALVTAALLDGGYEVSLVHHTRAASVGGGVVDYGGRLDVVDMVCLLAAHDAAVCVDSGPAHIAAAARVPLVVLLGAVGIGNHIRYDGWYGGPVREMAREQPCQPCWVMARYPGKCSRGPMARDCLRVEPESIVGAVDAVLSTGQ